MAKQNTDRKSPVTHKDLAILALMQGADALDPALTGHTDPVGVLEKVRATFVKHGKDTDALDAKITLWTARKAPGVKGRRPVSVGDARDYSVQRLGEDGDLFIRLPVDLLGVGKGDKVTCVFENSRIIVSASDA